MPHFKCFILLLLAAWLPFLAMAANTGTQRSATLHRLHCQRIRAFKKINGMTPSEYQNAAVQAAQ